MSSRNYYAFREVMNKMEEIDNYIDFGGYKDEHCNCMQMIYKPGDDFDSLCNHCSEGLRLFPVCRHTWMVRFLK